MAGAMNEVWAEAFITTATAIMHAVKVFMGILNITAAIILLGRTGGKANPAGSRRRLEPIDERLTYA